MGERLLAALAEIRPELEADALFHEGGFSMAKLEGLLSRGPDDDLATLFGDTLQGMIQGARYGAIKAVRQLYRAAGTLHTRPAMSIREGHTEVFIGSLRVHGDVENDGILIVTGDLEVRGRYIGPPYTYSLVAVGGVMRVRHASASGEIIAAGGIEANGVVHLSYNDYSSVLPRVRARALVTEDNFPVLGNVEVATRIDGFETSDADLQALFGDAATSLADGEPDGSRVRQLILANGEAVPIFVEDADLVGEVKSKAKRKSKPKPKPKRTAKPKPKSKPKAKSKPTAKPKRARSKTRSK